MTWLDNLDFKDNLPPVFSWNSVFELNWKRIQTLQLWVPDFWSSVVFVDRAGFLFFLREAKFKVDKTLWRKSILIAGRPTESSCRYFEQNLRLPSQAEKFVLDFGDFLLQKPLNFLPTKKTICVLWKHQYNANKK